MKVLFVSHSALDSNSFYHIWGIATQLRKAGHEAIVAVPLLPLDIRGQWNARNVWDYGDCLREWDRQGGHYRPDRIHCWSPRGMVQEFVAGVFDRDPSIPLIVHFEDPEYFLWEQGAGNDIDRSHPVFGRLFVELAQGVTVILPSLEALLEPSVPVHCLYPGIPPDFKPGGGLSRKLQSKLATAGEDGFLVGYFGNTHELNGEEVADVYRAVHSLRAKGRPVWLVRSGVDHPSFHALRTKAGIHDDGVISLGWVERSEMAGLMHRVDCLVQPGRPGIFNDHRLPSKLPEAFAVGIPVVMSRTNLGRAIPPESFPGYLIEDASVERIAASIEELMGHPERRLEYARRGERIAREMFNPERNTAGLINFYDSLPEKVERNWAAAIAPGSSRLKLTLALLAELKNRPVSAGLEALLAKAIVAFGEQDSGGGPTTDRDPEEQMACVETTWRAQDAIHDLVGALDRHLQNLEEADTSASETNRDLISAIEQVRAEVRSQDEERNRLREAYERELHWRRSVQASPAYRLLKPLLRTGIARRDIRAVDPEPNKVDPMLDALAASIGRLLQEAASDGFAHPEGIRFHIDLPARRVERIDSTLCAVAGWFLDASGRPASRIEIRAESNGVVCRLHQPRDEACRGIRNPPEEARLCGFVGEIPVHPGLYTFGVWVTTRDGETFELVRRTVVYIEPSALPERWSEQRMYEAWLRRYGCTRPIDRTGRMGSMSARPRISVCVPVYNTPARFLRECLDSMIAQSYPEWELCVADDASTDPWVSDILGDYAKRDERIHVVRRPVNGHIAEATNTALEHATGDYVGFLDHDDTLDPEALHHIVRAVREHPDGKLFYTDEDKIDEDGKRFDPFLKPDWNPDLFRSQNYLSHFTLVARTVLEEAGSMDPRKTGSQDWDLYLRVTERIQPDEIVHIPLILYHWRASDRSMAGSKTQKDYAITAGESALNDHLRRSGASGEASSHDGQYYRVRWKFPDPAPKISAIIPTKDQVNLLRVCLEGLLDKTDYPDLEIVVVDNASESPESQRYLAGIRARGVRVERYPHAFNFSAIANSGIEVAGGEIIALLNNDLEVIHPDWLQEMASQACRAEVGAVGAKLLYPDDRIQHAGVILGPGGCAGHAFKYLDRRVGRQMNRANLVQNYSAVTGACMVFRKAVFEEVGGFDVDNLKVAFNDVDFCLRLGKAGYRIVYTPFAELYHHESQSRGLEDDFEKQSRFGREMRYMKRTWGDWIANDPAYNPNLTIDREDFSLAWPPRLPEFAPRGAEG